MVIKRMEETRSYRIEYGEYDRCKCRGDCSCIDELQLCVWLKSEIVLFRLHRGQRVIIRQAWGTDEGWVKIVWGYTWRLEDEGIEIGWGVEELDCEGRGRRSKSWYWPLDGARVMIGSIIDPTLREEYELDEEEGY